MIEGFDNTKVWKLVASTSAAFPLVEDPWAALSHGLQLAPLELADLLETLANRGILAGIRGEPNPARPGASEAILHGTIPEATENSTVRWIARTSNGSILSSLCLIGEPRESLEPALMMTKCGFSGDLLSGQGSGMLSAETDRTVRVPEEPPEGEPFRDEYRALMEHYLTPRPLDPRQPFWEGVGNPVGLTGESAREGSRNAILSRQWRRLYLAFHPSRVGLEGIGMARWSFTRKQDARKAATALASIRGTADVAVRPADAGAAHVTALFAGRQPAEGEKAAQEIARQWGMDLHSWIDLEDFQVGS